MELDQPQLEWLVASLRQDYRSVLLLCIEAELACGRHERLLPELARLSAESDNASDVKLTALHMTALFRSGQQADAEAVYERHKHTLAEAGIFEVTREMRDLKYRIGNDDESLRLDPSEYAEYETEEPTDPAPNNGSPEQQPAAAPHNVFKTSMTGNEARSYSAEKMSFGKDADE